MAAPIIGGLHHARGKQGESRMIAMAVIGVLLLAAGAFVLGLIVGAMWAAEHLEKR